MYLAVADEEALGSLGADHLVTHEADAVRADYVITESGGIPIPSPTGLKLPVIVAEKGSHWARLRVSGTPATAASPTRPTTPWSRRRRWSSGSPSTNRPRRSTTSGGSSSRGWSTPRRWSARLLDPDALVDACDALPVGMARQFHACTHTTFAPTIAHGGTKINVIPDQVELQLDIRTLPGHGGGRGAGDARRGAR